MNTSKPPVPMKNSLAYMPSYYYLYRRPARGSYKALTTSYATPPTRYQRFGFSDDDRRSSIDRGPQTVEQLVTQGYFAVPQRDATTSIRSDRKQTTWLSLDDALTQIQRRREIYDKNMLDLEWAKCYAFNELARGGWPASEEKYAIYKGRLQKLHTDQRRERASFWRDVSMVRRAVPESIQNYLSAYRKVQILDEDGGDGL